jgi:DNA-binding transcriptional ArsR family regulator
LATGARLALASAALVVSAVVIVLKLVQPASISIYLGNAGNSTLVTKVPGLYSTIDVLEIFLATLVAGVCGTFILLDRPAEPTARVGEVVLSERKAKWMELSKTLKDEEVRVYQAVLDAGGIMNQGDIGKQVGLSKTTVSRVLDLLERRGLIEKRRRGMSNVILLK